ncbi:MAG: DUF2148 domain-containing protein [Bacteroidales bacterium]|jgi:uncharacterized ferredoxin-like protein|nr:DUF2148 domain-containing protein [Bacteroidales bacterium]
MLTEQEIRRETVFSVAKKMAVAARTAPKGRGVDNLEIKIISEKNELDAIANILEELAVKFNQDFFARDAKNIRHSDAVLLLGTKIKPMGLTVCGACGFKNCAEKIQYIEVPCIFNTNDLGIAIGSAVSIAADNRIDNRVMYTLGIAAKELKFFPDDVKIILGIVMGIYSKNIFFDR